MFRSCRTKLSFTGKLLRLDGSLAWHKLFHWKSFAVPIDPRKLQNFSTSNDLQYMVMLKYMWCNEYIATQYMTYDTGFIELIYSQGMTWYNTS